MRGRSERFAGGAGPAAEFWATAHESRQEIVNRYRSAWDFADATIDELTLDPVGHVWWWGDARITLHHAALHVIADTQRQAGHADILRELIDGATGLLRGADNLHIRDPADQQRFHEQVETAAAEFGHSSGRTAKASTSLRCPCQTP